MNFYQPVENLKMQLEIVNQEVTSRTVRSKKDNKDYTFFTQEAYLHDGTSTYPVRCVVPVSGPAAAYTPGRYSLASDSLYVDRFGNLALARRFNLVSDEV